MNLTIDEYSFETDYQWGAPIAKTVLKSYCYSERCNKPKFETDTKRVEIKTRRDAITCPNCHNVLVWERIKCT